MQNVFGHGRVNFAGQFDESRALSILPRLPGQVKWINGNAVSAQARAGIECHVAEWFGFGGVNDLPYVYAHRRINHLEFVDQGDVHTAKNILEQLGCLGCATRGQGHNTPDRLPIERHRLFPAGGGISSHHLGDHGHLAVGIAGIFAFRRKRQVKILSRLQTRPGLEDLAQVFIGRAGIGR